jgi:DNA-binding NtrC family response regulator
LTQKRYRVAKEATLREFNHAYIGRLLKTTGGNVTQAARACGLERQALQQIMRRYGIKADDYRCHKKSDTSRSV